MVTPEDNVRNTYLIGSINVDASDDDEKSGYTKKKYQKKAKLKLLGECKMYDFDDEYGCIPHVHIFNADRSFDSCVCVCSHHYYSHGGKYTSKFSARQCKAFHEWMQQQNSVEIMKATNWQCVVMLWEGGNPDCAYPIRRKIRRQPNYEMMINFI